MTKVDSIRHLTKPVCFHIFLFFHVSTLLFFLLLPYSVFSKTMSQTRPDFLVGTGEPNSHQSWQAEQGDDPQQVSPKPSSLGGWTTRSFSWGMFQSPQDCIDLCFSCGTSVTALHLLSAAKEFMGSNQAPLSTQGSVYYHLSHLTFLYISPHRPPLSGSARFLSVILILSGQHDLTHVYYITSSLTNRFSLSAAWWIVATERIFKFIWHFSLRHFLYFKWDNPLDTKFSFYRRANLFPLYPHKITNIYGLIFSTHICSRQPLPTVITGRLLHHIKGDTVVSRHTELCCTVDKQRGPEGARETPWP